MAEERDLSIPNSLFIKVSSSGLYRDDLTPYDAGQPWAQECAAMLCNESGAVTSCFSHIVKADGRTTKDGALKVHGITSRATMQIGIPEPRVLGLLSDMLRTAPLTAMKVISFGDMDRRIISSLFARFGDAQGNPNKYDRLWAARPGTEFIDIQKPACQQACRLASEFESGEWRWPTLEEAAKAILGLELDTERLHDALSDLRVVRDLYFKLAERHAVERLAA